MKLYYSDFKLFRNTRRDDLEIKITYTIIIEVFQDDVQKEGFSAAQPSAHREDCQWCIDLFKLAQTIMVYLENLFTSFIFLYAY